MANFVAIFFALTLFLAKMPPFGHSKEQTLWRSLYESHLDKLALSAEMSKKDMEMFMEMDQAESLLVEEMTSQISPPSPAHPTYQKFYSDRFGSESRQKSTEQSNTIRRKSSGLKNRWAKVRNWLGTVKMLKSADRVVKVYKKLRWDPDWGPLVQRIYSDLVTAKKFGTGNLKELQQNCRETLDLLSRDHPGIVLDSIEPYQDFWTLLKSSTNSFLVMFRGQGKGKSREKHTENIFRLLKTIIENGHIFEKNDDGSGKNGRSGQKRRRRKRFFTILLLFGIILACVGIFAFLANKYGKTSEEREEDAFFKGMRSRLDGLRNI